MFVGLKAAVELLLFLFKLINTCNWLRTHNYFCASTDYIKIIYILRANLRSSAKWPQPWIWKSKEKEIVARSQYNWCMSLGKYYVRIWDYLVNFTWIKHIYVRQGNAHTKYASLLAIIIKLTTVDYVEKWVI